MARIRPVAIICGGERLTHIPGALGDYATICGLDGEDEAIGQYRDEIQENEKITCEQCLMIWDVVRRFKASDFE